MVKRSVDKANNSITRVIAIMINVKVPFIEKNFIAPKRKVAIPVHAITINPRMETMINGPILRLIICVKFCIFGDLTSHIVSIVSRQTAKAPIAPPRVNPTFVIATQRDEKGDVELASSCLNNPATAGPASEVICCIKCCVA